MAKLRIFIGFPVPKTVRDRAGNLTVRLSATGANAKWVEPENLHFTLKFLGEVLDLRIDEICRAVQAAAYGHQPFNLHVFGAGAFPSAARPKTLWLGADEGRAAIIDFQADVERELRPLGFRSESRGFVPHMTLGRLRGSGHGTSELGAAIEKNADFDAGFCDVTEAIVYSSELERGAPLYQVLGRAKLGK